MSADDCTAAGTALYGVTGWPLSQSLSPLLHNTGFAALGINALYLKWEVPPQKLPTFVESVRLLNIRGCSVTIPHKVELLPLLDEVSPLARRVGAANTIYWKGESLCGENTDVAGFMAPLANVPLAGADVLLLGAGGAARAVAAGLVFPARPACPYLCGHAFRQIPSAAGRRIRPYPTAVAKPPRARTPAGHQYHASWHARQGRARYPVRFFAGHTPRARKRCQGNTLGLRHCVQSA